MSGIKGSALFRITRLGRQSTQLAMPFLRNRSFPLNSNFFCPRQFVIMHGMFSSEIKSVHFTGIGGTAMAAMFGRHRNILPLAVGQALLGSLLWWSFPLAWHHMLRVGPAYYEPY